MTPDPTLIGSVAAQFGIPPAVLMAVGQHESGYSQDIIDLTRRGGSGEYGAFQFMPSTLAGYNVTPDQIKGNLPLQAALAARMLKDLFTRYGSWERALSAYNSGDPNAYQSPTGTVSGYVASVLGIAAQQPTYGITDQFQPNSQDWLDSALSFRTSMQSLIGMGGVVSSNSLSAWDGIIARSGQGNGAQSNDLVYRGGRSLQNMPYSGSGAQMTPLGAGRSTDPIPFSLSGLPFDKRFVGDVTEGFGDTSGPGGYAESGNDYGLAHGSQVTAGVGGTVHVVDMGSHGTGLTVYVKLDNGWTVGYGHMGNANVKDGQRVGPGEVLGTSGGVSGVDASPGNSTGAHIEMQVIDPQGRFHDPHPLIVQAAGTPQQAQQPQQTPTGGKGGEPASPQEVSDFAQRAQSLGIDPDHLGQHYAQAAAMRRRLLEQNTSLEDYAPMRDLGPTEMLGYIQKLPHAVYNDITAGAFAQMHALASLHSVRQQGRTPFPGEVARLVAANADWKEVADFYSQTSPPQAPQTQRTSSQPMRDSPQMTQQNGSATSETRRQGQSY